MTIPAAYYDLRQAFQEPGCAFCTLLARTANRYIDGVLWEMVNDPEIRRELNQARGYCPRHAWMLVRHGASLGAAILLEDVITTLLNLLQAGRFSPSPAPAFSRLFTQNRPAAADTLVEALSPQIECPACSAVNTAEQHLIDALLAHLTGPRSLAADYGASQGLCLPHFRRVLGRANNQTVFKALVNAQQTAWQRLQTDLREFIRKNDHNVCEDFGPEGDSWLRAIEAIAGARPQRSD